MTKTEAYNVSYVKDITHHLVVEQCALSYRDTVKREPSCSVVLIPLHFNKFLFILQTFLKKRNHVSFIPDSSVSETIILVYFPQKLKIL